MQADLEIIYQDQYLVAINKPHNMLVHRSEIAADRTDWALQTLRDQIGQQVSPCHRLDSKTAGVLLFAIDKEAEVAMHEQFMDRRVSKKYTCLVRGFTPDEGFNDRSLTNLKGKEQEAYTRFKTIEQLEVPLPTGQFETSRYSLVEVCPETGRMHQIRRHFAQLRHYIIGDKPYGDCKQNKFFEEKFGSKIMMLHASELKFIHPIKHEEIIIKANFQPEFQRLLTALNAIKIN